MSLDRKTAVVAGLAAALVAGACVVTTSAQGISAAVTGTQQTSFAPAGLLGLENREAVLVLARPAASRSLVRREDVFRRADEEGVDAARQGTGGVAQGAASGDAPPSSNMTAGTADSQVEMIG